MNYAQIREMDISNGRGIGVSIFIQGCSFHCKGCFNPETWDFTGGKPFTNKELSFILNELNNSYISRFSILGGEPLDELNILDVAELIWEVHQEHPEKEIWLWTGFEWEKLLQLYPNVPSLEFILHNVDYIITGPFIQEEKDLTLKWRGSRNQRIIKCAESVRRYDTQGTIAPVLML